MAEGIRGGGEVASIRRTARNVWLELSAARWERFDSLNIFFRLVMQSTHRRLAGIAERLLQQWLHLRTGRR
jgi:hypothetical protein